MEEALKTGWFVGIGEFAPGSSARNLQLPGAEGKVSFEQRVEEWAALCELGVKYDVPVLCHDQFVWNRDGDWTLTQLLARVSADNPKAKIMQTHGCVEDEWTRGLDAIRDMYTVVAELPNVWMETGGWCEKQFEVAFEVGVSAARLTWGHDYGNVPQHIVRRGRGEVGAETEGPRVPQPHVAHDVRLTRTGRPCPPTSPTSTAGACGSSTGWATGSPRTRSTSSWAARPPSCTSCRCRIRGCSPKAGPTSSATERRRACPSSPGSRSSIPTRKVCGCQAKPCKIPLGHMADDDAPKK